jgi:hypothetical protein
VAWQLQEAKQRFSRLVQCALDEGQKVVARRGELDIRRSRDPAREVELDGR